MKERMATVLSQCILLLFILLSVTIQPSTLQDAQNTSKGNKKDSTEVNGNKTKPSSQELVTSRNKATQPVTKPTLPTAQVSKPKVDEHSNSVTKGGDQVTSKLNPTTPKLDSKQVVSQEQKPDKNTEKQNTSKIVSRIEPSKTGQLSKESQSGTNQKSILNPKEVTEKELSEEDEVTEEAVEPKSDDEQGTETEDEGDQTENNKNEEAKVVDSEDDVLKGNDENKQVKPAPVDDSESSHFFAYLVTSAILVAVLYIAYHNKRKIIAFALEGRRAKGFRRPNSGEYQRLEHKI
ncbi:trans-Golgi network integral membrane protein 2 [Bombina bombina]|uniref:trans-Golgi network integral membrane protein 2 n=1 Tax=Bombina bombina TaxID=8345 RepID=UPI00235AC77D|nr:trans-Golgi network integral membrane protein 2 [Bombina bombina]